MPIRANYRHTQYACYLGYITQAIVNNLAPLLFVIFQQAFAISLEKITLLVTGNFCLQLLVDLIAARFVDKIGYRPCVVAAHLFAAAGLIGMGTFPRLFPDPYAGLMLAVGLYAIGGGLIEVLISPIVEACPCFPPCFCRPPAGTAGACWPCCGPFCPCATRCTSPRCPLPPSPRRGRACPWASCSP